MSATLQAVITAVKQVAAAEIMPRYMKVAHQHKSDGSLCTEADLATQQALAARLRDIVQAPVLGEEMRAAEQQALWAAGQSGLWVMDPLDGTSNFVHGLPYFAVSVALMRNGESVLGVVHNPVNDETFAAERGKGAFLNGHALEHRGTKLSLQQALANVDLKRLDKKLAEQLAANPPYSSQRNFGASALDWCYTAAGRYDAYLHGGQKLWDYAAGALILAEAGGQVSSLEHDDFSLADVWQRSVIAALDPQLFNEWKQWIRNQTKI